MILVKLTSIAVKISIKNSFIKTKEFPIVLYKIDNKNKKIQTISAQIINIKIFLLLKIIIINTNKKNKFIIFIQKFIYFL